MNKVIGLPCIKYTLIKLWLVLVRYYSVSTDLQWETGLDEIGPLAQMLIPSLKKEAWFQAFQQ
jgi:hypothetical protein